MEARSFPPGAATGVYCGRLRAQVTRCSWTVASRPASESTPTASLWSASSRRRSSICCTSPSAIPTCPSSPPRSTRRRAAGHVSRDGPRRQGGPSPELVRVSGTVQLRCRSGLRWPPDRCPDDLLPASRPPLALPILGLYDFPAAPIANKHRYNPTQVLLVSDQVNGTDGFDEALLRHHGKIT